MPSRRCAATLLSAAIGAAWAGVAARAAGEPWPQVAPYSQRVELPASQPLSVPLHDLRGRPAYLLECRAEAGAIVHCSLRDAGRPRAASLLARAGQRDRGLFRVRDLEGACGAYPQFGRQRSFRLRGFELSLALVDGAGGPAGGPPPRALQVDVQPDALASAPEAEAPEAPDPDSPGHSCQAPPPVADPFSCRKPEVEVTKPGCTQ